MEEKRGREDVYFHYRRTRICEEKKTEEKEKLEEEGEEIRICSEEGKKDGRV